MAPTKPFYVVDSPTTKKLEALLARTGRMEREIGYLRSQVKRKWRDSLQAAATEIASFWLPTTDSQNYLFPARFTTRQTCYGYKVIYDQDGSQGLTGSSTTQHVIANPFITSWLLPGDVVLCWRNPHALWDANGGTSAAWEPFPGQGLLRRAITYKDIPASTDVTGDDIWLVDEGNQNLIEMSSDRVSHGWCHSQSDIEADTNNPKELYIACISTPGGYEFQIIDRECNTTPV